ncbi:MAG: hypothetical protein QM611_07355 [Microbacterium sp.]|uniref:hypothetical protein n=1 Tax=Microbacterium sp. TaxID=51671 RepID=UPI0039E5413C
MPSASEAGAGDDAPLTDAYRLLRRVSPPESPLPGWLASVGDGATVVLVAPDDVPAALVSPAEPGGHVLAPRDLVRCGAGLRVEFEWCTERVDRLLARREAARSALAAGECVTLAVSLSRGLAELAATRPRRERGWPAGEWWMTDRARPVFVHTPDGVSADDGARALWRRCAELTEHAGLRSTVSRHAEDGDLSAGAAFEEELFELAAAAAVSTAPTRARDLDAAAGLGARPDEAMRAPRAAPRRRRAFVERHVDADIAGLVSDALHAVVRRLRARGRPRPWLLAAGAAAAVIVVGAMWPTGDSAPAVAKPPASAASSPPAASPTPTRSPSAPAEAAGPERIAAALLDARIACRDDLECLADVVERPRAPWPAGASSAAAHEITLLDEFGSVAVLRVDDDQGGAQLVVIAHSDGRWLIRDVHDAERRDG